MKLLSRKSLAVSILLLLSSFLSGAGKRPLEPVAYWQKRVLNAHGGIEALGQISNLVFRGRIVTGGDSGSVILTLFRPGKLRARMIYSKKHEDRILLYHKGWRDFGKGFEEVTDHSLAAMIFQYNHLNLPMGLLENEFAISYVEQKVAGKNFPILQLIAGEEPPMAVIIDLASGLIQQVNGKISMGKNDVVMGVGYRDYKMVNGVMLPHRIINYVNGKKIAESVFDTVSVNTKLDPDSFYPGHHEGSK